jgi:hypothetical protein
MAAKPVNPTVPSLPVLMKLGSIVVHAQEFFSAYSHPADRIALEVLLGDEEVVEWLKQMAAMSLVPLRRN